VEPLFHQKLVIVAAPGFAIANSLAALSEAPWILPAAPDDLVRNTLAARFVAAGLPAPQPTYEANQLVVSLALVAQGLGLCAVPEIVVPDAETAGQVRRVVMRPAIEMPPTCLLHRRAMADHPRTRAISTAVRSVANEMMAQHEKPAPGVILRVVEEFRIPGAAQHEVMRCRPGIVTNTGLGRSRISGAPLRAAPRPGHENSLALPHSNQLLQLRRISP
jgi:hypothetical protein